MQNLEEPTAEEKKEEPLMSFDDTHESEWKDDWDQDDSKEEAGTHFCIFQSGATYYAIPLESVKEVVTQRFVTPIPHLPDHILGMTNVRGDIYSVFDLSLFLGEGQIPDAEHGYFMVLNHDEVAVAITVPGVPDTVRLIENDIQPLTNLTKKVKRPNYLGGVINRDDKMIISLKIDDIIESDEFSQISLEVNT